MELVTRGLQILYSSLKLNRTNYGSIKGLIIQICIELIVQQDYVHICNA